MSDLPREHWEGVLPRHLVQRSRAGEQMWTPTQFSKAFTVVVELEDCVVVNRVEDGLCGTLKHDYASGWYYDWRPDYSGGA